MTKDYKDLIVSQLTLVMKQRQKNNEIWKVKAYKKVIDIIKNCEEPIYKFDDICNLEGIGKGIKEKIQEIFDNDIIKEIEELSLDDTESSNIIDLLSGIYGVGIKKAQDLYNNHNIKSISDLESNKSLLNDKQQIGLKYFNDLLKRIPIDEANKHAKLIDDSIKQILTDNSDKSFDIKYEIAGSYRREENSCGDIDILITESNDNIEVFKLLIDKLLETKYIKETLAYGRKKFMGISKLSRFKTNRRIDILYTIPTQYPFAIFYFTGNYEFNIDIRKIAISKGLSLSEYGLTYIDGEKKGEYINHIFLTEKDIFDYLKIDYVEPKNRNKEALAKYL
jgi:DNA polymerase/3'-5' exonuclease PolX